MYLYKIESDKIRIAILSIYYFYLLVSRKLKYLVKISCLKYISIKFYFLKIRCALSEIMVYILRYLLYKLLYTLLFD